MKVSVDHGREDRKYRGRKHRKDPLKISLNQAKKGKAMVLETLCCVTHISNSPVR